MNKNARWVYYVVVYNSHLNAFARFLLTAPDLPTAERTVLSTLSSGWSSRHGAMVCSTTDDEFFKEL